MTRQERKELKAARIAARSDTERRNHAARLELGALPAEEPESEAVEPLAARVNDPDVVIVRRIGKRFRETDDGQA